MCVCMKHVTPQTCKSKAANNPGAQHARVSNYPHAHKTERSPPHLKSVGHGDGPGLPTPQGRLRVQLQPRGSRARGPRAAQGGHGDGGHSAGHAAVLGLGPAPGTACTRGACSGPALALALLRGWVGCGGVGLGQGQTLGAWCQRGWGWGWVVGGGEGGGCRSAGVQARVRREDEVLSSEEDHTGMCHAWWERQRVPSW